MTQLQYSARVVGERIDLLCRIRGVAREEFLKHMDWTGARYDEVCTDHMGTVNEDECADAAAFLKLPKEILIGTHGIDGQPVTADGEPLLPAFLIDGDVEVGKRLRATIGKVLGDSHPVAVGLWLTRTLPGLSSADANSMLNGRRRIGLVYVERIMQGLRGMAKGKGKEIPREDDILGPEWSHIAEFVRGFKTPIISASVPNGHDAQPGEGMEEHLPPEQIAVPNGAAHDTEEEEMDHVTDHSDGEPMDGTERATIPVAVRNLEELMQARRDIESVRAQCRVIADAWEQNEGFVNLVRKGRIPMTDAMLEKVAGIYGKPVDWFGQEHEPVEFNLDATEALSDPEAEAEAPPVQSDPDGSTIKETSEAEPTTAEAGDALEGVAEAMQPLLADSAAGGEEASVAGDFTEDDAPDHPVGDPADGESSGAVANDPGDKSGDDGLEAPIETASEPTINLGDSATRQLIGRNVDGLMQAKADAGMESIGTQVDHLAQRLRSSPSFVYNLRKGKAAVQRGDLDTLVVVFEKSSGWFVQEHSADEFKLQGAETQEATAEPLTADDETPRLAAVAEETAQQLEAAELLPEAAEGAATATPLPEPEATTDRAGSESEEIPALETVSPTPSAMPAERDTSIAAHESTAPVLLKAAELRAQIKTLAQLAERYRRALERQEQISKERREIYELIKPLQERESALLAELASLSATLDDPDGREAIEELAVIRKLVG